MELMDKNQRPIPMPAPLKIEWEKKQATTEQYVHQGKKRTPNIVYPVSHLVFLAPSILFKAKHCSSSHLTSKWNNSHVTISIDNFTLLAKLDKEPEASCIMLSMNNNNNNNFIVQFIEWKYILHFVGCIKTQYLNHVVTHVYSKIKHVNVS